MVFRVSVVVFLAAAAGCSSSGQPYVTDVRLDKGLVVVLTGIHGRLWLSESICKGLDEGGADCAIEIDDWTYEGKWLPFYNLGAYERNHEMAKRLAARIVQYQKDHPGGPVTLVGYSGGGPLAVWTAEAMPRGAQLDSLILLSTPLVPEYDLGPALAASRKGIASFYSKRDIVYLGLGTLIFGTMDKKHKVSAGNLGFIVPQSGQRAAAYQRLYQIRWRPEMGKLGYSGSHLTIGAGSFVACCIAPLVRAPTWDQDLIDRAARGQATAQITATRPAGASSATAAADVDGQAAK